MSFEDEKIESVSQELDAAAEKKVVGLEKISPSSILAFESFAGKKSSTVTDPNPYRAMYRESIRGSQETNIGERRGISMEDNKLLEIYMEKVDKDQRDLKDDIRESERRTQKRIEDSDKRIDEKMSLIVDIVREQNQKMDKIDLKIESVSKEVSSGLNEYRKFMWGISVSIFLAIAAMILTIVIP